VFLRRVVSQKFTDVSEVLAPSNIKAMLKEFLALVYLTLTSLNAVPNDKKSCFVFGRFRVQISAWRPEFYRGFP
jgi:hypothetical protein